MGGKELSFIREAFDSNYIAPLGPMVDAFENEFADYVGIEHCLAVSSGTASIHLALHLVGINSEDEVFVSDLTFIGSVSPIIFFRATPVFIDSDRSTWNMDPDLLETELSEREENGKLPKAVVPTDLYGQCANYERIYSICERFDVPVIADAAEALGSTYQFATDPHRPTQTFSSADSAEEKSSSLTRVNEKKAGNQFNIQNSKLKTEHHAGVGARAAVFSFNGNKIITTSGGGMLASDDKDFIDYARKLSQQAREDFVHYEHEEIGYNYRMSNILAAIGRGQLKVLDERVKRKREIFDYYQKALNNVPGIEFMPEAPYCRSNRWLTVILITPEEFGVDRETVRLALEAENIESRPVWKPMHLQPVFDPQITQINADLNYKKRYPCRVVGGEVAEDLFDRGLCLPSGTAMTEEDIDRVIDVIIRYHRQ
ncbi:MAG: aminotransferase class I/II-fold pyridoxal phosphate-dependent enzyme [Deltaproteobacteria bacterium]|nr:aminotransferase class I/II-fold pyridoxal phosphate-dependent enzyme [Deltaproteobacteria bacterium]